MQEKLNKFIVCIKESATIMLLSENVSAERITISWSNQPAALSEYAARIGNFCALFEMRSIELGRNLRVYEGGA